MLTVIDSKEKTRDTRLLEMSKPWIYLAPMAGVTDWAFREICYGLGAEVIVIPLVTATGLSRKPKRLLAALGPSHGNKRLVVQLYGKHPEEFRRAAHVITESMPAIGIDINMGCPANKVVGSNHGAALMRQPERAAEIVAATCAGTRLPVSVKIRSGWDSIVAPEFARLLESAGASFLTVHGRTREQLYKGANSLEVIAEAKRAVHIPVVGNGDIISVESARQMLAATGVDGLMLGRGVMGNPWLFAELQEHLKGNVHYRLPVEQRADVIREHVRLAFIAEGQHAAHTIRKHLIAYARAHRCSAQLRREVVHLKSHEDVEEWVNRWEAPARLGPLEGDVEPILPVS